MYSNEDLERFYFQYQTEALPSGESVQSFCKRNNVPYNIFSKWYKDTRKQTSTYNRLKEELLRRTTISRSPINYSEDMPSDQKDRYIRYLIEQHEEKDLELRAMKLAVEEFQSIHDGVVESLARFEKEMTEIRSELSSERNKRKAAEARARKLDQQLKFAQKNRFGDKRQKARKDEKKEDTADREDEKYRFDRI